MYFGAQYVMAAEHGAAIDAFAVEARRHSGARMFVGPKSRVDRFWERVQSWHVPPRAVRERQPLYALERGELLLHESVPVRRAAPEETETIVEHSANMIVGELGYDPRELRRGYTYRVRRLIERGWWWVWWEAGELRFMCHIGTRTEQTAQVQGVWTPPEFRGLGYATRALAAISRELLRDVPTLSLYVNDFNVDATSLYERVGFRRVGEFATYLFEP